MPRDQLERLRLPAALLLVVVAAVVFWPRGAAEPAAGDVPPTEEVIVGEPGGAVLATPSPTAAPSLIPTEAPAPQTPTPTVAPTEEPVPADGFAAQVLACRSISGSACNDQLGSLPANAGSFTALVLFTDANAGDQLNAILDGPAGTIAGTPYALGGGGDGYFWSQFQIAGLPAGDYVVTATRNGEPVGTTTFRKAG
jgi:hypothetical protein